jgi:type IV secretory pathway TraG/TraD family ATPase VirD4
MIVAGCVTALSAPLLSRLGVSRESTLVFFCGGLIHVGIGYLWGRLQASQSSNIPEYRRGAVVLDGERRDWRRRFRIPEYDPQATCDPNTPLTLAGIPVPLGDETKHFKFIGTTGTGKSTAMREIMSTALARGDRAIIADPDGGYLANFYNPQRGDLILNPFDPDSMKWNILSEINDDPDIDQLALSLIPDSGASERCWTEYARTFFVAITQRARLAGISDSLELYRLVAHAPDDEIRPLLANTPAATFLAPGTEKMFGSLRAVATSAVRVLDYINRQEGPAFSIRQWIREGSSRAAGGAGGVLFLPYKATEIAALRSVISAWLRIAIFEAMNGREFDQRLWFFIDEIDALGEIDGLKDALARLRKFGGRAALGLQSIAQLSARYGKDSATITENCGNTYVFRCSASESGGTSQFASRLIGQREVVHTTRSKSLAPGNWAPSVTRSEHLSIEPAVMPSEIERLPDLEGYLKLTSSPDWRRVRLTPRRYPTIPRPERSNTALKTPPPKTTAANAEPPPAPVPAAAAAPICRQPQSPPPAGAVSTLAQHQTATTATEARTDTKSPPPLACVPTPGPDPGSTTHSNASAPDRKRRRKAGSGVSPGDRAGKHAVRAAPTGATAVQADRPNVAPTPPAATQTELFSQASPPVPAARKSDRGKL